VDPPQGPLRDPLEHSIGHIKAVSCNKQLPHIRQPKSGPFTIFSIAARNLLPAGTYLKGE
jgi:hypothetical protein